MSDLTGYLAAEGFEDDLASEMTAAGMTIKSRHDRLFLSRSPAQDMVWAQNIWRNADYIPVTSIKDAANKLKAIQRNWAMYDFQLHRRAGLIQENLPHVSAKPIAFLAPVPKAPLGSWTLIDENTIVASADCSSPFRNGQVEFIEDKNAPPSRAYLKLWEFMTLKGVHPKKSDLCLDLGSSPGGWTWVLANLGCRVISVDKAPLADNVLKMDGVEYQSGSAFGIEPRQHEPVDWLFSDVICYPERLMNMVKRWMEADKARNYVCTIKFQGPTDHNAIAAFAAIPGSEIRHLSHNKHEVTWCKLAEVLKAF